MVSIGDSKSFRVGSNPTRAAMGTIFKYNDKIYQATNLDKKLKRLKIDKSDIQILSEVDNSELEKEYIKYNQEQKNIPDENWHNPRLYYFKNNKTKETIISIYDNLDNLNGIINVNDYERC